VGHLHSSVILIQSQDLNWIWNLSLSPGDYSRSVDVYGSESVRLIWRFGAVSGCETPAGYLILSGRNNPGEFYFRRTARRRGIPGRLSLGSSSNWAPLDAPNTAAFDLSWIRRRFTETASTSLHLSLADYRRALGLVQIVLLGNQDGAGPDMVRSFRRVGLAHLLAISGAHLGILLALVWWAARLLLWRPQ